MKKKIKKFFSGESRAAAVYNAFIAGQCVDCGHVLRADMIHPGRMVCPHCKWEVEFEIGGRSDGPQ